MGNFEKKTKKRERKLGDFSGRRSGDHWGWRQTMARTFTWHTLWAPAENAGLAECSSSRGNLVGVESLPLFWGNQFLPALMRRLPSDHGTTLSLFISQRDGSFVSFSSRNKAAHNVHLRKQQQPAPEFDETRNGQAGESRGILRFTFTGRFYEARTLTAFITRSDTSDR